MPNFFFRKACCLWDSLGKYGKAEQSTDDNLTKSTQQLRILILFVFPWQQWVCEHVLMSPYTHIACIVPLRVVSVLEEATYKTGHSIAVYQYWNDWRHDCIPAPSCVFVWSYVVPTPYQDILYTGQDSMLHNQILTEQATESHPRNIQVFYWSRKSSTKRRWRGGKN
jgi:hypothetical protein